jgi:hypothetical protein
MPEPDTSEVEETIRRLEEDPPKRLEDASVSIDGEKVDDPENYKGEPMPGGPTDPNAPRGPEAERRDED